MSRVATAFRSIDERAIRIVIKSLTLDHRLLGIEAGAGLETLSGGAAQSRKGAGFYGRQNGDRLRDRRFVVPLATLPI